MELAKLKALIYGDSGAGKTYLCGTFAQCAESSPVLVLNSRGQPVTYNLFDKLPCILEVIRMEDYNLPYKWIMEGQPWSVIEKGAEAEERFCLTVHEWFDRNGPVDVEGRKFRTIVLDSLTQTQRISIRQISGELDAMPGDIPSSTTRAIWGKTLGQLALLADLYYTLPIHVVVTALRRHQYVESQGANMYYPSFWGQSAEVLPSYAELLGMLVPIASLPVQQAMALREVELPEGERPYNSLILSGSRSHNAKWQGVRNPPSVVVNPTAAKLFDIMNGKVGG